LIRAAAGLDVVKRVAAPAAGVAVVVAPDVVAAVAAAPAVAVRKVFPAAVGGLVAPASAAFFDPCPGRFVAGFAQSRNCPGLATRVPIQPQLKGLLPLRGSTLLRETT
jgi:hypothetical protein